MTDSYPGNYKDLVIEEVCWDRVRERVLSINSSLAEAIDDISPGKEYTFFIAKYPYGSRIVDRGKFYLPLIDGNLVYVNDERVSKEVSKKIGHSPIPLCLVLSQTNETFVETSHRAVPLNFFVPGDLFGVFEIINLITQVFSEPMWSVTAGARTTFLLPRVNDTIGHNRMRKELNISVVPPKSLFEHFRVFTEIARATKSDWRNEILIFTNKWFENGNQKSAKLYKFLLTLCWKQLQLFRDTVESSLRWSSFAEEMGNRNIKPRLYLVDVVKYLISIAHGATLAFIPTTDCSALPVDLIQKVYTDIYGLKVYLPTTMQPSKFVRHGKPVYFSLSFPTILESSPHVRNAPSIMEDTREIKRLIQILTEAIIKQDNVSRDDSISSTEYDFFHTEIDHLSEIKPSRMITTQDERFLAFADRFDKRIPCENSPFFRGCIRISQKNIR